MMMVDMNIPNIETGFGHSSKGNQLKWEQDGWWYKADAFGYESLAEVLVSKLLSTSNLTEVVSYEPVMIRYRGKEYRGCRSRNFKKPGEELITLERLSRSYTSFGLAKQLSHIADVQKRIQYTEELVHNVTGIDCFGEYLTKLMEIDAFFLNEDCHTNNIALLYDKKQKEYHLCPFFDMGLSLFSDTKDAYPIHISFVEAREKIEAKPFSRDFDIQLDAANELYGCFLKFPFGEKEIIKALGDVRELEELYTQEELHRAIEVLRFQATKYKYMFT
jgi:hypothetical protein